MPAKEVIWLPVVREKLLTFRNERFTAEETMEFIVNLIVEVEEFLKNGILDRAYTEKFGAYQGLSRIVMRKFRIYFERDNDRIIVLAIVFPGEE